MHWDLKRDTFCAIVGAIHFLFFLGTFPELLGYILNGYVENMAKLTVCILSGLGFCALATAMSAVQSLELQVRKDRGSSGGLDGVARSQTSDDHGGNKSIPFNELGFRKNKAPKSVSENQDKADDWSLL
jgi:hypothetical protein